MSILTGKAFIFGNDIDTEEIVPARFLTSDIGETLARHCMQDVDPDFVRHMKPGDLIVAGRNFGSGSGREHAALALKEAGLSCVIAKSFGRIFYRNAINIGLPILECDGAFESVNQGDVLEVEIETGTINNPTKGETYQAKSFSPLLSKIIHSGGLMQAIRQGVLK